MSEATGDSRRRSRAEGRQTSEALGSDSGRPGTNSLHRGLQSLTAGQDQYSPSRPARTLAPETMEENLPTGSRSPRQASTVFFSVGHYFPCPLRPTDYWSSRLKTAE